MFFIKASPTLILLGAGLALFPLADWRIPWDLIPQGLMPLMIYFLRTFDLTMATLRMLAVVRGRASTAWIIGFIQALSFILGIAGVLSNLKNPMNLIAYVAGFATGNVIGIMIESKAAPGHSLMRIISPERGHLIAETLRELGRGATEVSAQGKQGMVSLIYCYVPRRTVRETRERILPLDPDVFITVENVRELRGGWRV
ncbi:MAG: hypothetical protein A2Z14_09645 [Chloroflexi bacterium RBG_16_48_8]|nr:MAG: hypothetical protein A2Z14_09645 [Chloroflexi bacterium RBG_16_48_8]